MMMLDVDDNDACWQSKNDRMEILQFFRRFFFQSERAKPNPKRMT